MRNRREIIEKSIFKKYEIIELGNDFLELKKFDLKIGIAISSMEGGHGYYNGEIEIPNIKNPLKYAKELAFIYLDLIHKSINTELYFESEFKENKNIYKFIYSINSDKLINKKHWDRIKNIPNYINYLQSWGYKDHRNNCNFIKRKIISKLIKVKH